MISNSSDQPADAQSATTHLRPGLAILQGRFTLVELLDAEQLGCGAPAVWLVEGPGATFIAKIWEKRTGDDAAIKAIWNHEVRSLLRLNGLPRAPDYFANLEALGADDQGYYAIVDGGGRQLLSEVLSARNQHQWLRRLDQPRIRAKLWQGLHRIATALVMLHDQGVLHRNLTGASVFTDTLGGCDLRLSGFEWSLRLSAAAHGGSFGAAPMRMRAPELSLGNAIYSIASDWFDFGLLAAALVADLTGTGDGLVALDNLRRSITTSLVLSEPERSLLLGLLLPNPDARRVQCAEVARRIGALAARLASNQGLSDRPVIVALRLASSSELAEAIFRLSRGQIRIDDAEGQLAFIQEDLSHGPAVTIRSGQTPHYALHGRQLSYRVYKYQSRRGAPSWRAGFCGGLDKGARDKGQSESMDGRPVLAGLSRQVELWLKDPTVRIVTWDEAFPFGPLSEGPGSDAYDFLRFTNTVDALLSAARIWPVTVVRRGRDKQGDWIMMEAARDEARDAMTRAIGLDLPARQMERAFVEEIGEVDGETEFNIVDEPRLTRHEEQQSRWVIREAPLHGGGRRYIFQRVRGLAEPAQGRAFLRPVDLGGSYALLERRLKAIDALLDQPTMLRSMEAPGSTSRDTMEEFQEDASIVRLDDRKRQALRDIWRTQPIFALQGPPGTGKTALVEALVGHALTGDPSLQFAATAQANNTVDYLGLKLSKTGSGCLTTGHPLVVRLDEDEEHQSPLAPARLAGELGISLQASELAQTAPPHIARRLTALGDGSGQEGKRERRDMARLVARAANVVLSTTTSRGLAVLLGEGKRFDWCLVEEAGKVHGFDLALPMLASHRMLMIGDHEQLPAFNEAAYRNLLGDPHRARDAITNGAQFIPRRLGFDLGPMESDEAMQAFESRCARWLPMVPTFGHVFQEANALPPGASPISARLNEQHRMHPEICDLMRACFYPDLRTADGSRARLEGPDPFQLIGASWLPNHRIVFVDMPWVQSVPGAKGQDTGPNGRTLLSSKVEADAVIEVLGQLLPGSNCELQVLAPYNRQVRLVRRAIGRARTADTLPNLQGFLKPKQGDEFGATIDGFQGEEADIVVVSLVRNNHAPVSGGVGFLSERSRLNVMLSRARRKLILIGSWEFFTKRATEEAWKDPTHPLHHLATVFRELAEACRNGTACRVALPGSAA